MSLKRTGFLDKMRRPIKIDVLVTEWPPSTHEKKPIPWNRWMREMQRKHKLKNVQLVDGGIPLGTVHYMRYKATRPRVWSICRFCRVLSEHANLDFKTLYYTALNIRDAYDDL